MLRHLRSERGVTLVELMVVVAIIAIIAAIAVALFQDLQKKAKLAADQGSVGAMRSSVALYYGKNNGLFPTDLTFSSDVAPCPQLIEAARDAELFMCESAMLEAAQDEANPARRGHMSAAEAGTAAKQAGAKRLRFLCLVAAPEGVRRMLETHPDVPIFAAALDRELNQLGYILPGLGDAGDRLFATH